MPALHLVVVQPAFAEAHGVLLRPFLFSIDGLHFFHCYSYQPTAIGMVEFEVMMKSNAGRSSVLLPIPSVVAILLEESHKNQFGFADQEKTHD